MNRNIFELFDNLLHPEAQPRENCGHMEICGAFTGDILNGINVFVAPSGYIKGNIKAGTLVIAGKVHGNVQAHSLVIHSSGELIYNKLVYRELLVEEGGVMFCANDAADAHGMPAISRAPAAAASEDTLNTQTSSQPVIHESAAEETLPQTPDMEKAASGIPTAGKTPARVPVVAEKELHFHSSF